MTAGFMCGAFQPVTKQLEAFRCTETAGHLDDEASDGLHRAEVDGQLMAEWRPR